MSDKVDLIENGSATGTGSWPGGRGTFAVAGTFDGSTITLQMLQADGTTWTDVGSDVEFTAAGVGNFELPPCDIRAEVDGGTSPSGLYAVAIQIRR